MSLVLEDEIICEMPVRGFLDAFLPVDCNVKFRKGLFRGVLSAEKNKKGRMMCSKLTTVINKAMDGFTVKYISTPEAMKSFQKHTDIPDIVAYMKVDAPKTRRELDDFSRAELCHHVLEDDIFLADISGKEEHENDCQSIPMKRVLACLLELAKRQHRTHFFHIFITPTIARLLRIDNSGLIVSQSIALGGDSTLLDEFYWRYSHAPADMRGHDPTIRRATDEEAAMALKAMSSQKHRFTFDGPFYVFEVPNSVRDASTTISRVVASPPVSEIIGRATRACPAFDLDLHQVLFLKDSWRQDDDDHDKESEILRDLHRKRVPHVPVLFAGDDVPGRYQTTISQNFSAETWRNGDRARLPSFVHHRVLLEFLPNNIMTFKTAHIMMRSLYDALIAHQQAYEKCGILHRDISDNNIRIRDGEGVLIDWDLAIRVWGPDGEDLVASGICQPQRQGTFEFMSSFLSQDPDKVHDLQDDLESFVWLVLYLSFCRLPYTTEDGSTFDDIYNIVFNDYIDHGRRFSGGVAKRFVLTDSEACTRGLDFPHQKPLFDWWNSAQRPFFLLVLHRGEKRHDPSSAIRYPFPSELLDHSYLISITKNALEQPGWSDITRESMPQVRPSPSDNDTSPSTSTVSDKQKEPHLDSNSSAGPGSKDSTPDAHSAKFQSSIADTKTQDDCTQQAQSQPVQKQVVPRRSTRTLKAQTAELRHSSGQRHTMTRRSTKNLKDQITDETPLVSQKQPTLRRSTRSLKGGTTNPPAGPSQPSTSGNKVDTAPKQQVKEASTSKLKAVFNSISKRTRSAAPEEEKDAPNDSKSGRKQARKRGRA